MLYSYCNYYIKQTRIKITTVLIIKLTWNAFYTSIFIVMTRVRYSPSSVWAVSNSSLCTNTLQINKPNLPSTFSIKCSICSSNCTANIQFITHNLCIIQIPSIITHCAPFTIVINLHSAFILSGAINKTNCKAINDVLEIKHITLFVHIFK